MSIHPPCDLALDLCHNTLLSCIETGSGRLPTDGEEVNETEVVKVFVVLELGTSLDFALGRLRCWKSVWRLRTESVLAQLLYDYKVCV